MMSRRMVASLSNSRAASSFSPTTCASSSMKTDQDHQILVAAQH
jgi:hypothetical protein